MVTVCNTQYFMFERERKKLGIENLLIKNTSSERIIVVYPVYDR